MKRRILLLMMTALLSVGAWAENVFTGSTAIGYFDNNSHVQGVEFPSTVSLQVGDLIVVTANVTGNYWNTINVCKAKNYWSGDVLLTLAHDIKSEDGKQFFIPVSSEILSALENGDPKNYLYFDGNDYTLTSVDVTHGNANLFTGTSEQRYGDGYRILPEQFALANTGDVLSISCNYVDNDEWGANIYIANNAGETLTTLNPGKSSSMPNTAYLVLTEDILTAAKSGGLRLKGGNYDFTSVDIYYSVTSRSVTIGSTGYATFGYPFAVDLRGLGEGQDAYTVTVIGDEAQLTSVKGKKIPANTGIILEGTNGNKIPLPLTTEDTDAIGTNNLHVSDGTVTGDGSTIYVLANGSKGVGFYKLQDDDGDTVPAGKAYLRISGGAAQARAFLGFGNGTTGIDNLTPALSNGEEVYYDLQGRRVAQPTKGLYIVNGKKVIIK